MWNVKFNLKIFFFYILFIQTKINERTKQNKTVVKIMKVLESCQIHAAHASFILIILLLGLLVVILEKVSKTLTSGN